MDTRSFSTNRGLGLTDASGTGHSLSVAELIEQLGGFVRRQYPIFVFVTTCAIGLGLLYLYTTPPRYTAHAMLLIDSSKVRILQQQQQPLNEVPLDTAQVETQVEVLKSENIGLAVIKDQRLEDDPEFAKSGGGLFGAVIDYLSNLLAAESIGGSEYNKSRRILRALLRERSISRVGRTYVLDIGFSSLSPVRAATVANGIADAYIVDQLEAKYQATRRASVWLQDRIKELRTQASAADLAVIDYKEKNNIVDSGSLGPNGSGTRLIGEQQLSELTTQLSAARVATSEAKAKLERTDEMRRQAVPDAAVADSLHNEVITRLRSQYLDLSSREAIWSARYGANHLAAVNLRNQMEQLRKSISDELSRIAQSYKSDYEIAKSRQEALEQGLASLVTDTQNTNRDRLGLRELESNAQVYHTIYDNFLQRYMEAIQQQSFPITEARVISAATPPTSKSSPQTSIVLTTCAFIGILLSSALAIGREAVDRVFRTTRQVEEILRVNCLAVLSFVKSGQVKALDGQKGRKLPGSETDLPHRILGAGGGILRHSVEDPLSSFAESFRSIKVAADINGSIKDNRVIGITSTLPREGKSTISVNLAQSMANGGKRVILIDGDLRNPTLTRAITPDATTGLLEVLAKKVPIEQAACVDEVTGLAFLPAVLETRLAHTNEILASEGFRSLIEVLREAYDYVVIDFPPMAPVVDVRATSNIVDSYIFVIEWGRTRINLVQHQLMGAPEVYERLIGVVLNKANVRILERYEYYYGKNYHKRYYSKYGYAE